MIPNTSLEVGVVAAASTSGWRVRIRVRKARDISFWVAVGATPSTA
jgi:hypothetical protein